MPIVSTELTEVAPKDPVTMAVVGDYIVCFGQNSSTTGLMPNGSFSVLDTTTETALAYGGLSTSTGSGRILAGMAVGASSKAWAFTQTNDLLYEVTPSTGAVTSHTIAGGGYGSSSGGNVIACNGWIVSLNRGTSVAKGYRISDGTNTTYTIATDFGMAASDSTWIYYYDDTDGWYKLDPTSGTISGPVAHASSPSGRGVASGGSIWFPYASGVIEVNPTTLGATTHTGLPSPFFPNGANLVAHSDGWLYTYDSSHDGLIGFDPVAYTFGAEALTPTRGHRYSVVSCNSKLWIPSGEPLT